MRRLCRLWRIAVGAETLILKLPLLRIPESWNTGLGALVLGTGIPYTFPYRHEDTNVPTFWLLLSGFKLQGLGFSSGVWSEGRMLGSAQ